MHAPSPEENPVVAHSPSGRRNPLPVVDVIPGSTGDHLEVISLLVQTLQSPIADDFQSRLDEPGYSPADRLLIRRGKRLAGHVHASRHIAWFAGERIPVARFDDLAILPEFAPAGYAQALLAAAEETAASEGALVVTALAPDPAPYRDRGWTRVRGQGHTRARTRAVLAHLDALQQHRRRRRRHEPQVRTWRLIDLDVIERLFAEQAPRGWGALHRSPEQWRWLAGRKVHDAILLATLPADSGKPGAAVAAADDAPAPEQIVGYAVLRDSQVIEMFVEPAAPAARTALLARACRDAIDRGHQYVSLHSPADDPLHELIVTAGGGWASQPSRGVWLAKLLAPDRWIERLYPELRKRAVAADIDRPAEVAFRVGEAVAAVVLTRRSARLESRRPGAAGPVACRDCVWQDLLLGNLSPVRAQQEGLLPPLEPDLEATVAGLLPPRQLWQSLWELLRQ